MPIYKDNAQNRKMNRVGKSWGKEAPKKSAPVEKASKKAAGGSNPVGFYEVLTTHKDYRDSANATMDRIEKSKISGKWYNGNAVGGAGISGNMTLSQAKSIRTKFNLGNAMRRVTTDNPKMPYVNYHSF